MISITKSQRDELERVGLLTIKEKGKQGTIRKDQNFVVTNRQNKSRAKNWYVTEDWDILCFLGKWDSVNLQPVTPAQIDKLMKADLLHENQIQKPGEYRKTALAYLDRKGQYRIKKVTDLMKALNIWK